MISSPDKLSSRTAALPAACLFAALLPACHRAPPEPVPEPPPNEVWLQPAEVARARIAAHPVEETELEQSIYTSGRITFDDTRVQHVFSPVAGRVTQLYAQLGAHVKKGDPLALIQSPDIGIASSDLGKANADLIAAQHNFERQKRLFSNHAASELDLETAEDNYRKARAEMERAKQRMVLMHGDQAGGVTQGYTLRAEIEGEVMMRAASPGMEISGQYQVGGNVELFTIGTLDKVWVLADVYEIDLARVAVGAKVTVTVVSYADRTFEGRVDWVAGMLDPNQRTARVRCVFDNADHALRPEMYATVRIVTAPRRVLAIPRQALFRVGEQTFVFIMQPDHAGDLVRFARIPVSANEGQASGLIEVQRGLSKGQQVVSEGLQQLRSLLDNAPPRAGGGTR